MADATAVLTPVLQAGYSPSFAKTNTVANGVASSSSVVAISGSRMVVGVPGEDRVYTYTKTSGSWTQTSYFQGTAGQSFGASVAMSGDGLVLLVGAPGYSSSRGRAYVYDWNSGTSNWVLRGSAIAYVVNLVGGAFGQCVCMSGDANVLYISAWGTSSGNIGSGIVYRYAKNGTSWTRSSVTRLHPDMPTSTEAGFGINPASLATNQNGSTLVVGAWNWAAYPSNYYGRVYTFAWTGSAYTITNTLDHLTQCLAGDENSFGWTLALETSGTTLYLTYRDATNARYGVVARFTLSAGAWGSEYAAILPAPGETCDTSQDVSASASVVTLVKVVNEPSQITVQEWIYDPVTPPPSSIMGLGAPAADWIPDTMVYLDTSPAIAEAYSYYANTASGYAVNLAANGDGTRIAYSIQSGGGNSVVVAWCDLGDFSTGTDQTINEVSGDIGFGAAGIDLSTNGCILVIAQNASTGLAYPHVYTWDCNGSQFTKRSGTPLSLSAFTTCVDVAMSGDGNVLVVAVDATIRTFVQSGGDWVQDTAADISYSAESVALDGSGMTLAVSNGSIDHVVVYTRNAVGDDWAQSETIIRPVSGQTGNFGCDVHLDNTGQSLIVSEDEYSTQAPSYLWQFWKLAGYANYSNNNKATITGNGAWIGASVYHGGVQARETRAVVMATMLEWTAGYPNNSIVAIYSLGKEWTVRGYVGDPFVQAGNADAILTGVESELGLGYANVLTENTGVTVILPVSGVGMNADTPDIFPVAVTQIDCTADGRRVAATNGATVYLADIDVDLCTGVYLGSISNQDMLNEGSNGIIYCVGLSASGTCLALAGMRLVGGSICPAIFIYKDADGVGAFTYWRSFTVQTQQIVCKNVACDDAGRLFVMGLPDAVSTHAETNTTYTVGGYLTIDIDDDGVAELNGQLGNEILVDGMYWWSNAGVGGTLDVSGDGSNYAVYYNTPTNDMVVSSLTPASSANGTHVGKNICLGVNGRDVFYDGTTDGGHYHPVIGKIDTLYHGTYNQNGQGTRLFAYGRMAMTLSANSRGVHIKDLIAPGLVITSYVPGVMVFGGEFTAQGMDGGMALGSVVAVGGTGPGDVPVSGHDIVSAMGATTSVQTENMYSVAVNCSCGVDMAASAIRTVGAMVTIVPHMDASVSPNLESWASISISSMVDVQADEYRDRRVAASISASYWVSAGHIMTRHASAHVSPLGAVSMVASRDMSEMPNSITGAIRLDVVKAWLDMAGDASTMMCSADIELREGVIVSADLYGVHESFNTGADTRLDRFNSALITPFGAMYIEGEERYVSASLDGAASMTVTVNIQRGATMEKIERTWNDEDATGLRIDGTATKKGESWLVKR